MYLEVVWLLQPLSVENIKLYLKTHLNELREWMFYRCKTCGEYIYKGKKFNARKETVQNELYLGLPIFRFYIKCTRCLAEITFKVSILSLDFSLLPSEMRGKTWLLVCLCHCLIVHQIISFTVISRVSIIDRSRKHRLRNGARGNAKLSSRKVDWRGGEKNSTREGGWGTE